MIEDLLEVTRAETGKLAIHPQFVPVIDLVDDTLKTMKVAASGKGVHLSKEASQGLPLAYADPDRVRQILINLIDNAIKFTPEHGEVKVGAQVFADDPHFLCMSVADTGCGIPPEESKRIFDSMYQVQDSIEMNRKGIGLGLYICKELVSRHGGRIWVDSEVGRGSTFYFTLPIFSWSGQMDRIFISKNLETGSMVLLAVEIFFRNKRLFTKSDEPLLRESWNILKQCILIDKDVLLPRIASTKRKEIFFIIAFADQKGTEVLQQRIREQIGCTQALQEAGLEATLSYSTFKVPSRLDDRGRESLVNQITRNMGDRMKKAFQEEDLK